MGQPLLNEIIELTGLPKELVTQELLDLLDKKGIDTSSLNLENLRLVLVDYLQDVILKAKEEFK